MLIKNGFVTDPGTQRAGVCDIRIEDGLIREISADIPASPSEEVVDAGGLTVAPGLIDTHVHFRDPGFTHKETLHTGALAAARGGFTSVICMANTSPVVDSLPVLKDILARAKEEKIRIYQAASVSRSLKGEEMTDMAALKSAGACGFTDDGIPLRNAAFL
ncbi:MAG TPA: amidohydrolase family protein, partial [Candidatus Mediterraneibacter caccavium]|nr:amidohydrolase family protein [Candidatus Mediterraneibacter caccavium]